MRVSLQRARCGVNISSVYSSGSFTTSKPGKKDTQPWRDTRIRNEVPVVNQDINAVILGQDFGSQMKIMFEKDMDASRLVTLEEWRKRSIGPRIKEFAARLLSRWI